MQTSTVAGSQENRVRSFYPWVLVALLWVVALLNYLDRQMLATMKPSMQGDIAELQLAANFGRLMAVFLWVYGMMSPFAGMIADKLSKKWLIVASLFIWSAVTLAMGYAETFNQLYWLRAMMGVSEAVYIPASMALIADFHPPKTRSLAIGVHVTGIYVGQGLGGFGATIAGAFTWHTAFHFFGWVGIIYSLMLVFFLRDDHHNYVDTPADSSGGTGKGSLLRVLGVLFTNISFWIILFYFAVPGIPGWGVKNWLPTLLSQKLGIDMSLAGPLSTITISASSLLGVLFGGILSDRWARRNIRGRVFTSAIGLALTIPAILLIGYGSTLFHLVAAAFCFGFGFGMFDANNMPILCQFVASKYRATAYGFMNMIGVFAGAMITEFLGRSTDKGDLGKDFAMLAIIVVAALLIQLSFLRPKHHDFT
jgi:MFS family permease